MLRCGGRGQTHFVHDIAAHACSSTPQRLDNLDAYGVAQSLCELGNPLLIALAGKIFAPT